MVESFVHNDGQRALHRATGSIEYADIVKTVIGYRSPTLQLVVWDLRNALPLITTDELTTAVTVTIPVHRNPPQVLLLLNDRELATRAHQVFTRVAPPWSWRIITDNTEADGIVREHFPAHC